MDKDIKESAMIINPCPKKETFLDFGKKLWNDPIFNVNFWQNIHEQCICSLRETWDKRPFEEIWTGGGVTATLV